MGKHSKKSKKHKKRTRTVSASSSSENEWVEADSLKKLKSHSNTSSEDETDRKKLKKHDCSMRNVKIETKRDQWMDLPTNFSSFSNQDSRKQKDEDKKLEKEREKYNPSTSTRELNVYWKNGGDGLPKFHKPKDEDSSKQYSGKRSSRLHSSSTPRWKKKTDSEKVAENSVREPSDQTEIMTENDLNLLAGKIVKAEIMGNEKLIAELKLKLEKGREMLRQTKSQENEVLLTQVNQQGHSRPLTLPSSSQEGSRNRKPSKKAVDTHTDRQRVRYFADDDKYSLKQMFESERYSSANDQDATFMKIASKIRKNDDLDDLFVDNVRRQKDEYDTDKKAHDKTVNEHKKVACTLDNCPRCIQSKVMQKHLIIALGEFVFLSVPEHEPLLKGHCLIAPIRHVAAVTQLDENEWNEMKDFRKALLRLFESQGQEVIFFEVAMGFHRYPHMVLECIPLESEEASMAPMYFKKAIDESETEWSQNKKLVSLKNRDVRQAIPKELSYFSVAFGRDEGFAHVIEDEQLFPKNFAQEIIGGMLDLDHSLWRRPVKQSFDMQSKRALAFTDEWKAFDCTLANK
ncbi:hypothetical protein ABEB36_000561 [Hypothenemus hampei]|uniref:CWF19-like protein 2 n=1 Tax=Hypothenemus hampei TaxID=57062 RepID=A0ABD1FBQ0_HYPHA